MEDGADGGADFFQRAHKLAAAGITTAHGHPVERRLLIGQDGLALKTPATQDALDAAEFAVILKKGLAIGRGEPSGVGGALELGSCQPAARQKVWAKNSASINPPTPVLMARWSWPGGVRSLQMRWRMRAISAFQDGV